MAEGKPRLARLAAIMTQLQTKRIVTAREIAEKHDVSIRTVYRDMRTLEKSGIPIVTEEGRGYSILEGYKLPPIMFTEQEANALITAEQLISKNSDKSLTDHYKTAVEKIRAVLRHTQKDKSELLTQRLDVRSKIDKGKTSDYLIQIQSAITNYNVAVIKYYSLQKKKSTRSIEPFALIHTQDNWILIAYCRLREDLRAFRLDCIQSFSIGNDYFEPHKMTLKEYFDKKRKIWESTPDIPLT